MLLEFSECVLDKGHIVDLIIVNDEGEYLDRIPKKANTIYLHSNRGIMSCPELIVYLRNNSPEALISTGPVLNIMSTLSKNLARVDTKIVNRVANINSKKEYSKFKGKILTSLMKKSYSKVDSIIAISEGVEQDLVHEYGVSKDKINVIYNPAYSGDITKLREEKPDNFQMFEDDLPVIIGVGRLVRQKDFLTLIQAFKIVQKRIDSKLLILGKGHRRRELEEEARSLGIYSKVSMPGFVDNPYAYMYRSDVFVLSSIFEGFGNVLVEAMACACPIVTTDCPGGPGEIVGYGQFGKLVPVRNPESMAEAVIETLEGNHCAEEELLTRAQEFSREKIADRYLQVLLG